MIERQRKRDDVEIRWMIELKIKTFDMKGHGYELFYCDSNWIINWKQLQYVQTYIYIYIYYGFVFVPVDD